MKYKMLCIALLLCSLSSLSLHAGNGTSGLVGDDLWTTEESDGSESEGEKEAKQEKGSGLQSGEESDSELAQSDEPKEEEKEEVAVASSEDEKQDQASPVADSLDKGEEEEKGAGLQSGNESDPELPPLDEGVSKKEEKGSGLQSEDESDPELPSLDEPKEEKEVPQKSQGLWEAAKDMTTMRLAALTALVSLLGYGAYKGYEMLMAWWQDYVEGEQPVKLTTKERDILVSLMEAMAEDVKHLRDGTEQPSAVKQFDIGALSMPLAIECNFMQHGFIELYNQCGQGSDADVDTLEMFYNQFNEVVRSVIDRAEIVQDEVQEASAA